VHDRLNRIGVGAGPAFVGRQPKGTEKKRRKKKKKGRGSLLPEQKATLPGIRQSERKKEGEKLAAAWKRARLPPTTLPTNMGRGESKTTKESRPPADLPEKRGGLGGRGEKKKRGRTLTAVAPRVPARTPGAP